MREFRVNELITLKLEGGKTNIYLNDQLFNLCQFILLNRSIYKISTFNEIDSIEEKFEFFIISFKFHQVNNFL